MTIYFNDGSSEVIHDDRLVCFQRIVYERLGWDAGKMFDCIIEDLTKEPDGEDWEKIADGLHTMLLDTLEEINGILNYAKSSGMKKDKLITKLQNCKDELYKNI